MMVMKRYCDYDYDNNCIILFDAADAEQIEDDLNICWISSGPNKEFEDSVLDDDDAGGKSDADVSPVSSSISSSSVEDKKLKTNFELMHKYNQNNTQNSNIHANNDQMRAMQYYEAVRNNAQANNHAQTTNNTNIGTIKGMTMVAPAGAAPMMGSPMQYARNNRNYHRQMPNNMAQPQYYGRNPGNRRQRLVPPTMPRDHFFNNLPPPNVVYPLNDQYMPRHANMKARNNVYSRTYSR